MDIALTETQSLLRDAIRDYLQKEVSFDRIRQLESDGGYDRELWSYLAGSGFLGLPFPESLGGGGGELTDLAVLMEELTRRAVVIPFMETMASALTVQRHASADMAREVLAGVIGGATTIAPAVLESGDRWDQCDATVSGGRLSGVKCFVDYGQVVTHHLVSAREGATTGLYLVDANAPEVTMVPLRNIGRTPQANVTYAGAPARAAGGAEAAEFLVSCARSLAAIQCLGNAQQSLDMTVEYVAMRVQFGRPIGTFQAVQHHVANMATMTLATRFLAYEAVWKLDRGSATVRDIATAKAWASKTATETPMMAHQLYGGIGFTEEYDLHFFSRKGKERALAWGTSEEMLGVLGETIGEVESWL